MLEIRRAAERGHNDLGWLDSQHTFSFADYYDPRYLGFSVLRVINDDRVAPARGFGMHPHRDMEIISYVLSGSLEHKDSMGNGSVIRAGDVQRMSAGTGVMHSEHNASGDDTVHFLQIWILPEAQGLNPGYEQKHFTDADKRGRLRLVASRDGREDSVTLHQDASVYAGLLNGDDSAEYAVPEGRNAWVHLARGKLELNGRVLEAGDGVAVRSAMNLQFHQADDAEVLLFDLPVAA